MRLVHLTASSFFGGPERQMLGLARALPAHYHTTFLSFAEGGRCDAFLEQVADRGFNGQSLRNDTPNFRAALRELTDCLRLLETDVLICHGYKSNLLGRIAARRTGIPIVSVSRGWTGENLKMRLYDKLDRFHLRYMDAVVAVSNGQAEKVRLAGVLDKNLTTIHNAARLDAFHSPLPQYRQRLRELAGARDDGKIIVAAGRLSPEKGFAVLIEAAGLLQKDATNHRIVLFGEGAQRPALEARIEQLGLQKHFILAGFRDDLDHWLPWADVVVLPSFTEGLPNVALEASAAGVPVVATAVGGTPEVVRDGVTGYLVPSGDHVQLACRMLELCANDARRMAMGEAGRRFMREQFSFEAQSESYQELLERLAPCRGVVFGVAA